MNKITQDIKSKAEERETILIYNDLDKTWTADTTIPKHYRRFIKQGWKQVSETNTSSGEFVAAEFEACDKAISIGRAIRPKKVMSEEHKAKLLKNNPLYQKNHSNCD